MAVGVFTRARDIYSKAVCNCDRRRSVVNCTVPVPVPVPQSKVGASSKEMIDGGDLRGLMQLIAMGGAKVDVDSEGNIVWRKAAEGSYGGGVGKIGRIEEDKPCCFKEVDVLHKLYPRINNNNNNNHIAMINTKLPT